VSAPGERERRCARRHALVLGTAFALAYLAYSVWWMPVVHGEPGWIVPGDIWMSTRVSDYIRYGAYAWVYQAAPGYYALPLAAILLVPAMVIADASHLVSGFPEPIAHPTMWLVVGPYSLAFGIAALHAVRVAAWQYGLRQRLALVQLATVALVLVPCAAMGHPEDVLAFAFTCYGVAAADRHDLGRSAVWLGLAVCSKQWAVLAVPFVVLGCPRPDRLQFAVRAALPPLILLAPALIMDPQDTLRAVLAPTTPVGLIWGHDGLLLLLAGADASRWSRAGAVLASFLLAVWLMRRRAAFLLDGIAVAFLLRALAEPVVFGYYLAPGLGFLLLSSCRRRGRLDPGDLAAVCLAMLWGLPARMGSEIWWTGEAVVFALTGAQLYLVGLRGTRPATTLAPAALAPPAA
jgi:hypothetical protein